MILFTSVRSFRDAVDVRGDAAEPSDQNGYEGAANRTEHRSQNRIYRDGEFPNLEVAVPRFLFTLLHGFSTRSASALRRRNMPL